MLELLVSFILFWLFSFYFYYLLKTYFHTRHIFLFIMACILSIPTLNIKSVFFIFEVHFVIISLITRLFMKDVHLKKATLCIIPFPLIISTMLVSYGIWNMDHIVRTEYHLTTTKDISHNQKITMLSDLHYPSSTSKDELNKLVQRINQENSDIIILNGDIVDEHTTPSQIIDLFQTLQSLTNKSQVFYTFGNHDSGKYSLSYQIDIKTLENIIESCGITVLKDDVITLGNITIVGRNDYSLKTRKNISELLNPIQKDQYIIVADHQPRELKTISQQHVDLHLSGHVHAGQIFPLYYIYELLNINELNYGLEKYQDMIAINTSGVAGWGFPVRTQKHSEYVVINIKQIP